MAWFRNPFRRTPAPTTSAANPGRGTVLRVAGAGAPEVRIELTSSLAAALRARGIELKERGSWLELKPGIVLMPRLLNATRGADGAWSTSTTVEAVQADFFPSGIFEFQHHVGHDLTSALAGGFEGFADLDLPVLTAAASGALGPCHGVTFQRPSAKFDLPVSRQVILGPVRHLASSSAVGEGHSFCPCCFFTHATAAMKGKLQSREFFAIRLYAARNHHGELDADCRVNGLDWPEGQRALLDYAATWPNRGFELRKQYIAIHSLG